MVLQMYAKFGNLKELDFFLIFIDEMFGGNRSILWENDFEGLMMFYSYPSLVCLEYQWMFS